MVSNLSMAGISNDATYFNTYNDMATAFATSGSTFFDSYTREEIPLAIEEMRTSVFNNLPIDRELILWRGLKNISEEAYDDLCTKISVNQLKRFTKITACSFNEDVACRSFAAGDRSVLIKIIVPKGRRILNLNVISSKINNEAEVIIPDNTFFRVINIENADECGMKFGGEGTTCKKLITLRVENQWNPKTNRYEPQIDPSTNFSVQSTKPEVTPLYYGLFPTNMPEAVQRLEDRLEMLGIFLNDFDVSPLRNMHVTLLYLGGRAPTSGSANAMLAQNIKELMDKSGRSTVRIRRLVSSNELIVADVELLSDPPGSTIPCANRYPHVTIALRVMVGNVPTSAKMAHDLLTALYSYQATGQFKPGIDAEGFHNINVFALDMDIPMIYKAVTK
jgi:hypothetical protein